MSLKFLAKKGGLLPPVAVEAATPPPVMTFKAKPKVDVPPPSTSVPEKKVFTFKAASKEPAKTQDLMEELGLSAPVPISKIVKEVADSKVPPISVHDRVVITNDLFPWVTCWKPGDRGVVVQMWAAPHSEHTDKVRDALFAVVLDTPRIEGHDEVTVSRWQITREDLYAGSD